MDKKVTINVNSLYGMHCYHKLYTVHYSSKEDLKALDEFIKAGIQAYEDWKINGD